MPRSERNHKAHRAARRRAVLDESWLKDAVSSLVEGQLHVPLYIVAPDDGSILWSNRAFANLFGYEVDEVRHRTVFDLHLPEDTADAGRMLRKVVRDGSGTEVCRTRTKNLATLDVQVDARLVRHRGRDLILSMASPTGYGQPGRGVADAPNDRDAMERFGVFNKILRTVNFSLDLEWMARRVSELARGLIQHDRLSLTLVSPAQDVAVVHAIESESPVLGRGTVLPLNAMSNAGVVVGGGKTVVRSDLRQEGPFIERDPLLAAGIRSFVSTPMWSGGLCIGTLNVGSRQPGAYGADEARIAEEISSNIGEMVARSQYLSNLLAPERPRNGLPETGEPGDLSRREVQVLRLLAAGKRNAQIANDLGLSLNSVLFHLANVFSKLGVHSRIEATLAAVRRGLVRIDSVEVADAG